MEKPKRNPFYSFLYADPWSKAQYVFVVLRIIISYTWLVRDIPRWTALAAGHPVTIPPDVLQKNLPQLAAFGTQNSVTVFYIATTFETLAAILLVLGLATRLGALWGVIRPGKEGTHNHTLRRYLSARDFHFTLVQLHESLLSPSRVERHWMVSTSAVGQS